MKTDPETETMSFYERAASLLTWDEGGLSYPAAYGIYGDLALLLTAALSLCADAPVSEEMARALASSARACLLSYRGKPCPAEIAYTALLLREGLPEARALLAEAAENGLVYATKALGGSDVYEGDRRLGFLLPLCVSDTPLLVACRMQESAAAALVPEELFSFAALLLLTTALGGAGSVAPYVSLLLACLSADGTPLLGATEWERAFFRMLAPALSAAAGGAAYVLPPTDTRSPKGCFALAFAGLLAWIAAQKLTLPPRASAYLAPEESAESALLIGRRRTVGFSGRALLWTLSLSDSRLLLSAAPDLVLCGDTARLSPLRVRLSPMKGGLLARGQATLFADAGAGDTGGVALGTLFYAAAALPDDETLIFLSAFRAETRFYAERLSPLTLFVHDAGEEASYYYAGERHARAKLQKKKEPILLGRHCHMSDAIGVVATGELTLALSASDAGDAIAPIAEGTPRLYTAGETVSFGAAVAAGSVRRTYALADGFLTLDGLPAGVKSVSAVAANRKRYTLLYNLSDAPFEWEGHTLAVGDGVLLAWDR